VPIAITWYVWYYNYNKREEHKEREVYTMITKTFEHKGQMINYFNKVRKNPNISFCTMGFEVGTGYTIHYCYIKR
jgi:hypothetical protein